MSSRVYLFFPPHDHEPSPTPHNRLNPYLSLQHRRFPTPRYAKRPDVALNAVGPPSLLPIPSSPHYCTLKVSDYDSLWQPPAAHSDEHPRPHMSSRAQRCLNARTLGYVTGTVVQGHPIMVFMAMFFLSAVTISGLLSKTSLLYLYAWSTPINMSLSESHVLAIVFASSGKALVVCRPYNKWV